MVCLIQTESLPATVAQEAAPQADPQEAAVDRVDPAGATLEAPQLRQKLLRLIIEREAQRKLQRSD
jgi:hypothetical protein